MRDHREACKFLLPTAKMWSREVPVDTPNARLSESRNFLENGIGPLCRCVVGIDQDCQTVFFFSFHGMYSVSFLRLGPRLTRGPKASTREHLHRHEPYQPRLAVEPLIATAINGSAPVHAPAELLPALYPRHRLAGDQMGD